MCKKLIQSITQAIGLSKKPQRSVIPAPDEAKERESGADFIGAAFAEAAPANLKRIKLGGVRKKAQDTLPGLGL